MYSTTEITKILSLTERNVRYIVRQYKIPFLKHSRKRYFNLSNFLVYKYKGFIFVQSLDESTPNIYYGFSPKKEIKINLTEVFDTRYLIKQGENFVKESVLIDGFPA